MFSRLLTGITSFIVGLTALTLSGHTHVASGTTTQTDTSSSTNTSQTTTTPQAFTAADSSVSTSNWAGYTATSGTYTGVSGSWTVPDATGDGGTSVDATWIGIGGTTSDDLIQVGTQNIVSGNSQVSTSAFYEILPDASQTVPDITVHDGDSMTASITETSTDQWKITLTDNTDGQSYSTNVTYDSSLSSAEWIEEDPSDGNTQVPLDNFGTVTFTGCTAIQNGSSVSIATSGAQAISMAEEEDQDLAVPSTLSSNGEGFSVERSSSSDSGGSTGSGNSGFDVSPGGWVRRSSRVGSNWDWDAPSPSETVVPSYGGGYSGYYGGGYGGWGSSYEYESYGYPY